MKLKYSLVIVTVKESYYHLTASNNIIKSNKVTTSSDLYKSNPIDVIVVLNENTPVKQGQLYYANECANENISNKLFVYLCKSPEGIGLECVLIDEEVVTTTQQYLMSSRAVIATSNIFFGEPPYCIYLDDIIDFYNKEGRLPQINVHEDLTNEMPTVKNNRGFIEFDIYKFDVEINIVKTLISEMLTDYRKQNVDKMIDVLSSMVEVYSPINAFINKQILMTPSGKNRNEWTDLNIRISSIIEDAKQILNK